MRTRLTSSSHSVPSSKGQHQPVLLHEVLHALNILPDDVVLDATLGGGGHAKELIKGLGGNGLFIGFDADSDAVERSRELCADSAPHTHFIVANFRNIEKELVSRDIPNITKALFDLGWSSYQLNSGRGFSFLADEPLRMTYEKEGETLNAGVAVNTWAEESLADVIYGFGGERYARRIAKAIVERRKKSPFKTAKELAEVIRFAVPRAARYGRIHPSTKTFQALRIAVNDELGALKEGLEAAWKFLVPSGRIAVISFHSLEDRIVKQMFAEWAKQGGGKLIARKPIVPGEDEIRENPRSRSAKLRVIERISHESTHTKNKQIHPVNLSGEI